MWTRSDGSEYQYEFSHFTTNGTDWKPASESPLASKFEGLEDGWYVEFAEARYLLVTNRRGGRGLNRRVHFSLDGQDDWYEETRLGAITAPNSAYTVQERVVATSRGRVHRREADGSWTDITPGGEFRDDLELQVAGSLIVVEPRLPEKTRVTTDVGETWTKPDVSSTYSTPVLNNVVQLGGKYYTLATAQPAEGEGNPDTQLLLSSGDATSWSSTEINPDAPLNTKSLTALDGALYALDSRSRLVRIGLNLGEVTIVTDSEPSLRGDYNGLYKAGSTLVGSSAGGNIGSVLTWQPGDSSWSLPDSAPINAYQIDVREGRLHATAVEYQAYDREAQRWRLIGSPRPENRKLSGDRRVAWNPTSGCVYLREGGGWNPRLQWTESGVVESCEDDRASVEITDVVAYRDGYAIGARSPSNGKILARWNPESDAIDSLNPVDVSLPDLPEVLQLLNVEGELWIRTADEGAPELANGIFRLQDGSWKKVQINLNDGETPTDSARPTSIRRMGAYGDEVVAKIAYERSYDGWVNGFVRWSPENERFRWLELPDDVPTPTIDSYDRALHTDLGPTLASDDQLWRFDISADRWETVGQPYPEARFRPEQVVAGERSVYVETANGRIFVTRASKEGATE
jgi:hypothetical protein